MKDEKDDSTENSGQNNGTRRGRRENLKPWAKGVSGNPGGRPRKQQISDEYALRAGMELPESLRLGLKLPKGATYAAALVLGQFRAGIKGNTVAAKEIADRVEGRVPLPMKVEPPEETEIRVIVRHFVPPFRPKELTNGSQEKQTGTQDPAAIEPEPGPAERQPWERPRSKNA